MSNPAPDPLPEPPALDDVRWDTLRHAHGAATDLPHMLVKAFGADEDAARKAIGDLDSAIIHWGGEIRSAAPAVLPFLLALAAGPGRAPQVRHDALALVRDLCSTAGRCDPRDVRPDWPGALSARVPELEGLLGDRDPLIRRDAADVLAHAVDDFDRVLVALHDRWRVERDPLTRLTLLAGAADLLDRHPRGEEIHDGVCGTRPGPTPCRGATVRAVRWIIDQERSGDLDERMVLLAADVTARTPPGPLRLAFEAVDDLVREEAPLWAAALLHDPGTREDVVRFAPYWLLDRFGADPAARGELAERMLGTDTVNARRTGLRGVSRLIAESRRAEDAWAPVLARHLDDPDEGVRSRAALALAVCGPAVAGPWADRLAALAAGPPADDTNHALFALARLGDDRVVAPLRARAHLVGLGFSTSRSDKGGWNFGPHMADLVRALAVCADDLVPVFRDLLRSGRDGAERTAVVDALHDWGEAAAPLVPELAEVLDSPRDPFHAMRALSAIGPAASDHADRFLAWAQGREKPGGVRERDALHAYWRLTGDADTVLELFDAGSDDPFTWYGTRLRLFAELGPRAAGRAEEVRRHVRESRHGSRPEALLALWRVTGERDAVLRTILDGDLLGGRSGARGLRAVRILGRMGAEAEEALPRLRELLSRSARIEPWRFGWRDVVFDHRFTAAVGDAVQRIESGADPQ